MSSSPTGSAELTSSVIEQTRVREITYMIFRWLDILVNDLHLMCSVISVVLDVVGGRDSRIQVFQGQAMVVVEAAAVAAGPTRLQRWPGSVACGPQQSKVGCCWWSAGVVVGAAAGWSSSSSSPARQ